MVMRLFLVFGVVLLGVTAYFTVIQQPPTVQAIPTVPEIAKLQEEGILPSGPLVENEEVEHDVFGVPPEDEERLEQAMADMDMNMDMEDGQTMEMAEGQTMQPSDGGTDMAGADQPMNMAETTAMDAEEAERLEAGMMAGLVVRDEGAFDREIKLSMSEWTFSDLNIDAKAGERIKFTLRNDGKILHEFMFMSMPAMQAVNYRAKRADWNLLEHEALYEKSLLMPGEEITFVAQVTKPGAWMFMCMLPYHMQMGMMGQMATEGMAMQM